MKSLQDQNIVFTGTLGLMKRAEATKKAILAGATVLSSLTKAATLVVAGADAGSKLDKARDQGVEIWDEETFVAVLNGTANESEDPPPKKAAATPAKKLSTPTRGVFSSPGTRAERLKELPPPKFDVRSDSVSGKHICFTGALRIRRAKAIELAEKFGAIVHSSVTNKVDILVTAYAPGEKLIEGLGKGCEIWNESNFFEAVKYDLAVEDEADDDEDDEDGGNDEDGGDGEEGDEMEVDVPKSKAKPKASPAKKQQAQKKSDEEPEDSGEGSSLVTSLKGQNIVFTGTLALLKRADAAKKATAAGAKVLSSITKAATLIVAGADAGAKLDKANELGLEIWDEQKFVDAVGGLDSVSATPTNAKAASKTSKSATTTPARKRKVEVDEEEDEHDEAEDTATGASSLKGQNIVFTGTLTLLKRADAAKKATAAGAKVLSSITKAATLVVAGADAGAKLDKARDDGLEIWDEQKFVDAIGGLDSVVSTPKSKAKAKSSPTKKQKAEEEDEDAEEEPKSAGEFSSQSTSLKGQNIVFTGTLALLKRADAAKKAADAGAKVLSSITKAATLIVAGADAGAKLDKANELGLEIWDEQKFVDAVGGL
ncbi:UNVERIFIED_CONTAM: hypothetical protein HDU68_008825 [Siphonaria sp. JEL0065]|nr:hypothetical protein HDU68_008825 [Siphonaria sp. JEL0065]